MPTVMPAEEWDSYPTFDEDDEGQSGFDDFADDNPDDWLEFSDE